MKTNSKGTGTILSYLAVIATMAANILLIPFYLSAIGEDEYGLYQYIYSLAQYAMVLDFGISTIMIKYISRYRVEHDRQGQENFAAHAMLITGAAASVIMGIGVILYLNIDSVIVNRSAEEMQIARNVFFFMIGRILVALIHHYFEGVLLAYEKYVHAKGIIFLRVVLRVALIVALVLGGHGIYGIVIGEFAASVFCLLVCVISSFRETDFCIRWHRFDGLLLRESGVLVFALILQSVVTYMNNVLDKYIVGSYLTNTAVAVYTVALSVSEVFVNMTTTVNSIFLPKVSRLVAENADGKALTDYAITIGRIQGILCIGMLGGFLTLGRQFITLWTGSSMLQAWPLAVMILAATAIPLMQSTCLSILAVKNKRLFRSVMLLIMAVVHVIVSVLLVSRIGLIGVAVGSVAATLLGNGLIMNIYYRRVIGLDVVRMLREIFRGILPAAALASLATLPFALWLNQGIVWFLAGAAVFCIVYGAGLYGFGLRKGEKALVTNFVGKVLRRNGH